MAKTSARKFEQDAAFANVEAVEPSRGCVLSTTLNNVMHELFPLSAANGVEEHVLGACLCLDMLTMIRRITDGRTTFSECAPKVRCTAQPIINLLDGQFRCKRIDFTNCLLRCHIHELFEQA